MEALSKYHSFLYTGCTHASGELSTGPPDLIIDAQATRLLPVRNNQRRLLRVRNNGCVGWSWYTHHHYQTKNMVPVATE